MNLRRINSKYFQLRTLIWVFSAFSVQSQNLIPNPGFEELVVQNYMPGVGYTDTSFASTYVSCWVNVDDGLYLPIFNSTSPDPTYRQIYGSNSLRPFRIPRNGNGFLQIYQGDSYLSHVVRDTLYGDRRSSAQVRLIQPLEAGVTYKFSAYVMPGYNRPGNSSTSFESYLFNFGVYFSTIHESHNNVMPLNSGGPIYFNAQLDLGSTWNLIPNQYNLVEGFYTASGGEKYMSLGNFDYMHEKNMYQGSPPIPDSLGIYCMLDLDDLSLIPINSTDTTSPKVFLGNDTTFCDAPVDLTLSVPDGYEQYVWSTGDTTQTLHITLPGTYWIRVNAECAYCNDSITVRYESLKSHTLGMDTLICEDSFRPFSLSTNNSTYDSYLWSTGATSPQITIADSGWVWLDAVYACGIDRDSLLVAFKSNPLPPVTVDTNLCQGDFFQLQAQGYDLIWYEKESNSSGNSLAPIMNDSMAGTYVYFVTQTVNECESEKARVEIHIDSPPDFYLPQWDSSCVYDTKYYGPSAANLDFQWSDGATHSPRKFQSSGTYILHASNYCGELEKDISIELQECNCTFFIPNAITRNADILNDQLTIAYDCDWEQFHLMLFNKWGEKILEIHDPEEIHSFNNDLLQPGVYTLVYTYQGRYRESVSNRQHLVVLK